MVPLVVGCSGSRGLWPGWDAWHGMQDFTASSTHLSIPGNQTFSLIQFCFDLGEPDGQWL